MFTPDDAQELLMTRLHSRQAFERLFRSENQILRSYWNRQREHSSWGMETMPGPYAELDAVGSEDVLEDSEGPGFVEYAGANENMHTAAYSAGVEGDVFLELHSDELYEDASHDAGSPAVSENALPAPVPSVFLDFVDDNEGLSTSEMEVLGVYTCSANGFIFTLQAEVAVESGNGNVGAEGRGNLGQYGGPNIGPRTLYLRVFDANGVFLSSATLPQLQGIRYTVLSAVLHPQCDSLLMAIQITPLSRIWRASEFQFAELRDSYGLLKLSFHWESDVPMGSFRSQIDPSLHSGFFPNFPRKLAAHLLPKAHHPYLIQLMRKRMFEERLPVPLVTLPSPGLKPPFNIHPIPHRPVSESSDHHESAIHRLAPPPQPEEQQLVFSDPHPIGYTLLPLSLPQTLEDGTGGVLHTQLAAEYDTGAVGSATVYLAGAVISPLGKVETFAHAVLDTPMPSTPGHAMIALRDTFCQNTKAEGAVPGIDANMGPPEQEFPPACGDIQHITTVPGGNVIGTLVYARGDYFLQVIQRRHRPLTGYSLEYSKPIPIPRVRPELGRLDQRTKQTISGFTAFADVPNVTQGYGFAVSFEDVMLLFDGAANPIGRINAPIRDIVWNTATKEFIGVTDTSNEGSSTVVFRKIRMDLETTIY